MDTTSSRILLRSLLTVFAMMTGISVAHADHSWGEYHWARTNNPFVLYVGDNLTTGDWKTQLGNVLNDWNNPNGAEDGGYVNTVDSTGDIFVQPRLATGVGGSSCSAVQGTTQVCNKKYGKNGWLGLATIWLSSSHINQGTAKMNDTYLGAINGKYNTASERRHVMCQEVAHTFGLGHQSTTGASLNTCMDYYSNTGINATSTLSTRPDNHDFQQLHDIYVQHTDGFYSASQTVAAMTMAPARANAQDVEDQKSWGRLLSQSEDGRSSIYEQEGDVGVKIIRHVLWTDETAEKCQKCDHRTHEKE
ncbi:MAG: hypothetical protein OEV08_09615 [Nitrospira sp.]|nr:hypothetical protein [Nitrospira sp.]